MAGGADPARERRRHGQAGRSRQHPAGERRVQLHEVRVPDDPGVAGARHRPAGHLRLRRPAGDEEDRRDGRGALRDGRAAQPDGPVATAVNVHFAASTPNFLILEYHPDDTQPAQGPAEGAADGEGRLHARCRPSRVSGSS